MKKRKETTIDSELKRILIAIKKKKKKFPV
jgi:hypothetical protein